MENVTMKTLAPKIRQKRGARGLRETATEIGISPATLSRLEKGHVPDLDTFRRMCQWLHLDPGKVLGFAPPRLAQSETLGVHFRKEKTIDSEAAQALANMILAAEKMLRERAGK